MEPSRVFDAVGLEGRAASQSVRTGFGRTTTTDNVDHAVERLSVEVDAFLSRAMNKAARRTIASAQAASARRARPGS